MLNENEIQNETDESLLTELNAIDTERAERSSGSTASQRKARASYMRSYRTVKNDPQKKIEAQWADNLSKLPEAERKRLQDAVEEVLFLDHLMALVERGVGYCGVGIGEVDKDYPNPEAVYEEVLDWISKGNTFV